MSSNAGVSSTMRIRGADVTVTAISAAIVCGAERYGQLMLLTWRRCLGLLPVLAAIVSSAAAPAAAQTPSSTSAASLLPADPLWVVNFEPAPEHSAPDDASDQTATLRPFTYLAVLGYDGEWARVLNPRTSDVGFVPSDTLGPTDPPPAYVTADPPPAVDEINADGRTLRG